MENDLPVRKNMRLKGYDYSRTGAYFITVCIKEKLPLLWEEKETIRLIRELDVRKNCNKPFLPPLSKTGKLVQEAIEQIPQYYNGVKVDMYCIMPDHIHMVLAIMSDKNGLSQETPDVSRVVKQLKSWVSKKAGQTIWQKSFMDMVVRNDKAYREIRTYVHLNPYRFIYCEQRTQKLI